MYWRNETLQIYPICSMYGIFTYIYHRCKPNVGKYFIHGTFGYGNHVKLSLFVTPNRSPTASFLRSSKFEGSTCAMVKSRYIGDGHPTFHRNPYNWYINPYYWVDDHPLLFGNNGSLDPGTYQKTRKTLANLDLFKVIFYGLYQGKSRCWTPIWEICLTFSKHLKQIKAKETQKKWFGWYCWMKTFVSSPYMINKHRSMQRNFSSQRTFWQMFCRRQQNQPSVIFWKEKQHQSKRDHIFRE